MDDNWKRRFELIGVSEEQKQTKETMEFIYDFGEKSGRIENVTSENETERKAVPPPPSGDMGKLHPLLCGKMLK